MSGLVGAQGWKETNRKGAGTWQRRGNSRKARWWQSHRRPVVVTFAESRCKSWGSGEAALQAPLAEMGGAVRGAEKGVREQTNPRQKISRGNGRPPSQLGGLVQRSKF